MSAQKMVKIRLFKGPGRFANDVFVGLNGKGYLIKRGVDVEVPAGVAEIIRHSEEQDALTANHMEQMATIH